MDDFSKIFIGAAAAQLVFGMPMYAIGTALIGIYLHLRAEANK